MNEFKEQALLGAVYKIIKDHRIDNGLFPEMDKSYFIMNEELAKCVAMSIAEHIANNHYGPDTPSAQTVK